VFGSEYICKLFRKLEPGPNPEVELSRVVTQHGAYSSSPALLGVVEYQTGRQEPAAFATLHRFVPNQGDAWQMTRDVLDRYFERGLSLPPESTTGAAPVVDLAAPLHGSLLDRSLQSMPDGFAQLADVYPAQIRLLGQRTAELHRALAAPTEVELRPEAFTTMYQRSLYESTRTRLKKALAMLRKKRDVFSERERPVVDEILARHGEFTTVLRRMVNTKIDAQRIRTHGDFHLGQVLFTGKDFVIIDFEGEPGRTLAERRFKHCVLRDVAGLVRSLDYAALAALRGGSVRPSDVPRLEPFARAWSAAMSAAFVHSYLMTLAGSGLIPEAPAQVSALLDFYLLDKCLYELDYEFNNRPDWVSIPLYGLLGLMEQKQPASSPPPPSVKELVSPRSSQ
jgi:maltose alpha-D-glucosyltransferase/alpha-amylase